jgi:CheY-like chemotaxis protein
LVAKNHLYGIEYTKRIRSDSPENEQPVIIAITAIIFLEDRESCLEAGMNDFLTKPVFIEEIKDMINKWFN